MVIGFCESEFFVTPNVAKAEYQLGKFFGITHKQDTATNQCQQPEFQASTLTLVPTTSKDGKEHCDCSRYMTLASMASLIPYLVLGSCKFVVNLLRK